MQSTISKPGMATFLLLTSPQPSIAYQCNCTMQLHLLRPRFCTPPGIVPSPPLPSTKKELSTISGRHRLEMLEMRYSLAHCSRELQCLTCSPWITTCCCRGGSHYTTPSSLHGLSWKCVRMVLYKGWRQLWLKSTSLQSFNNFTFIH
jgi:hypothetical protein